jgi:hypothetical protein
MVALTGTEIVDVSLKDALAVPKRVRLDGDPVATARGLGICLGD